MSNLEIASGLDTYGKRRLTRLAGREASRLQNHYWSNVYEGSTYGLTPESRTRGRRLATARAKRNYRGMIQFTPKRALRAAGIIN